MHTLSLRDMRAKSLYLEVCAVRRLFPFSSLCSFLPFFFLVFYVCCILICRFSVAIVPLLFHFSAICFYSVIYFAPLYFEFHYYLLAIVLFAFKWISLRSSLSHTLQRASARNETIFCLQSARHTGIMAFIDQNSMRARLPHFLRDITEAIGLGSV